ncbi:hypothetical protein [Thiorhodococcus fuscus]|uniref:Transposase n=1 Tax=Thiorhodococcus fuscus TaxID=527200 RepID=A0ABW4YBB7_9GAMM
MMMHAVFHSDSTWADARDVRASRQQKGCSKGFGPEDIARPIRVRMRAPIEPKPAPGTLQAAAF